MSAHATTKHVGFGDQIRRLETIFEELPFIQAFIGVPELETRIAAHQEDMARLRHREAWTQVVVNITKAVMAAAVVFLAATATTNILVGLTVGVVLAFAGLMATRGIVKTTVNQKDDDGMQELRNDAVALFLRYEAMDWGHVKAPRHVLSEGRLGMFFEYLKIG